MMGNMLIEKTVILAQQPAFLWVAPDYYEIERIGRSVYLRFDRFHNKKAIILKMAGLVLFLLLLCVILIRLAFPLWAIIFPIAAIILGIFVGYFARKTPFKDSYIRITKDKCLIHTSISEHELHSLVEVLLQIRSVSRDGHSIGEMGDRELFLKSQHSDGRALYFPLAIHGCVDRLGVDLANIAGCPFEKEFIGKKARN